MLEFALIFALSQMPLSNSEFRPILTSVPTVPLHEELAYHHILGVSTAKVDVHASCTRLLRF